MLWTLTALTDPPGNHAALATPRKTPSILESLASLLSSQPPLLSLILFSARNTLFSFLFFFLLSFFFYSFSFRPVLLHPKLLASSVCFYLFSLYALHSLSSMLLRRISFFLFFFSFIVLVFSFSFFSFIRFGFCCSFDHVRETKTLFDGSKGALFPWSVQEFQTFWDSQISHGGAREIPRACTRERTSERLFYTPVSLLVSVFLPAGGRHALRFLLRSFLSPKVLGSQWW